MYLTVDSVLVKATFPNNCDLTTISTEAFEWSGLTQVIFGTDTEIRDIGHEAFRSCGNLSIINRQI